MKIGELCNREVITAKPENSTYELASIMFNQHVGSLVIVEPSDTGNRPIGIVTDRDLVLKVVAQGLDPNKTIAADIMTPDIVTAHLNSDVLSTIRQMRSHGVRRLPVVNHHQDLAGILSLDDLIDVIVSELGELSNTISTGQHKEKLNFQGISSK